MCFIMLGLLCIWDFLKKNFGYFWEWLVNERLRLKFFLAYKSSFRDLISRWTPRERNTKSDVIRTLKPSL